MGTDSKQSKFIHWKMMYFTWDETDSKWLIYFINLVDALRFGVWTFSLSVICGERGFVRRYSLGDSNSNPPVANKAVYRPHKGVRFIVALLILLENYSTVIFKIQLKFDRFSTWLFLPVFRKQLKCSDQCNYWSVKCPFSCQKQDKTLCSMR